MRFIRHIGFFLVGALLVGGSSYVGAQALTAQEGVSLAQAEQAPPAEEAKRRPHTMRRAIRGELVVPGETEGSFETVRMDRGIVERVDESTIVIKEDDGTVVEVPTTGDTTITRDRESAKVADIKAGDHLNSVRVKSGESFVTRHVRAISPERWAEMEQRREQCRENRESCPRPGRHRRPGSPQGEGITQGAGVDETA